jgi:acetyl-CoA carboxylase biotin carboxyl carrier protein
MRLEEVRKLIKLVEESEIGELEVWKWWGRIRISRAPAPSANGNAPVLPAAGTEVRIPAPSKPAADAATETKSSEEASWTSIKSPMVGTFYRAPAPDADPYVEAGDWIEPGQTICIIEAMKLMNEIQSEVRGRVVKILVANGHPVEYGQALLLVDESGR